MLKIRLQRIGRKNDPAFRVVVIESQRSSKAGRYLEMLGSHAPRKHQTTLKAERITHWISKGAQVSDTVHNLLITQGIRQGKKINALPRKQPITNDLQPTTGKETAAVEPAADDSRPATEEKTIEEEQSSS